jgi:hypothetical protein
MPDFLNAVMDEAAAIIGDVSMIKRQQSRAEQMTEQQLTRLRQRAAQIVVMLQAAEVA